MFSKYEPFSQVFETDITQNKKIADLINNADSVRGNLRVYNNSVNNLSRNRDFNSKRLIDLDINKEPDVHEVALQDINEMITQQNNMYIMGMITATVLIVSCFLLVRK